MSAGTLPRASGCPPLADVLQGRAHLRVSQDGDPGPEDSMAVSSTPPRSPPDLTCPRLRHFAMLWGAGVGLRDRWLLGAGLPALGSGPDSSHLQRGPFARCLAVRPCLRQGGLALGPSISDPQSTSAPQLHTDFFFFFFSATLSCQCPPPPPQAPVLNEHTSPKNQ